MRIYAHQAALLVTASIMSTLVATRAPAVACLRLAALNTSGPPLQPTGMISRESRRVKHIESVLTKRFSISAGTSSQYRPSATPFAFPARVSRFFATRIPLCSSNASNGMSGMAAAGAAPVLPSKYAGLSIDAKRTLSMLESSCAWGNTPDGGMNRLTCNDDDRRVRDWFIEETQKCGCEIKIDQMGNIFATRPGQNNKLPPVALGSHLDTQPTGGRFDGILGVVSALEVLQTIHANNITTYAPLAIVNWTNEEGARFPPAMLCSGVWGGEFTVDWAHSRTDNDGRTLKQELERIGYLGNVPCSYDANPLLAHFELHIEQGPILDAAELPVAAVQGVQSMSWFHIDVAGHEAHTGTTPMDRRGDALLGAAKMIVETNKFVTTGQLAARGARATIAVINSTPQSINTIAGKVRMGLDIRSPANEDVAEVERLCREAFQKICDDAGLTVTVDRFWTSPAVQFDPIMVACVRDSARDVGCNMELVSGAGHDSVYTSRKVPTAMIFVRCRDGVSHNPAEYARPQDCATGAQTLLGAYLRYDEYVRQTSAST